MAEIEKNCYNLQPILPLALTGDMTYLQMLMKLQNTVNALVEFVENFETDYKTYTDAEILKLREYTDEEIEKIQLEFENVYDEIAAQKAEILSDVIAVLQNTVSNLYEYIDSGDKKAIAELWILYGKLSEQLNDYLKEGFLILNPLNGKVESVQKVVNSLYSTFTNCLTYSEIANLQMTYSEIAAKQLTYGEWLLESYHVFIGEYGKIINPVQMKSTTVQVAIFDLAALHYIGKTYLQIFELGETYAEFAARDLTYKDLPYTNW